MFTYNVYHICIYTKRWKFNLPCLKHLKQWNWIPFQSPPSINGHSCIWSSWECKQQLRRDWHKWSRKHRRSRTFGPKEAKQQVFKVDWEPLVSPGWESMWGWERGARNSRITMQQWGRTQEKSVIIHPSYSRVFAETAGTVQGNRVTHAFTRIWTCSTPAVPTQSQGNGPYYGKYSVWIISVNL